jgi:hypothetical protein
MTTYAALNDMAVIAKELPDRCRDLGPYGYGAGGG